MRLLFILNTSVTLTVLCVYALHFERSSGETIAAHYQVFPEVGLRGLSCLSQHVKYNRAVRSNDTSSICEMLDDTWNRNPVFDSGFIYMQMLSYHNPFPKSFKASLNIPEDFEAGSRFEVVFKIPSFVPRNFNIRVQDYRSNTTFIQVLFKPSDNYTVLRSELNGNLTDEVIAPCPIFSQNAVYTVTVYYHVDHWDVFFEGSHFKNYSHVYPFINTGNQKARFWSFDVECLSITFHWPEY